MAEEPTLWAQIAALAVSPLEETARELGEMLDRAREVAAASAEELRGLWRRLDGLLPGANAAELDGDAAQDWLRESEEFLSLAVDATGIAFFDHRIASGEVVVSERARRLVGLASDETITPELAKGFVYPDDVPALLVAFTRALDVDGPREWEVEHRIRRLDGEVRWLRTRGRMVFAEADGVPGAVRCIGGAIDVTERRRALEALRAERDERVYLEDRLRRTERLAALGTLAGRIAEEIQPPLAEVASALVEIGERLRGSKVGADVVALVGGVRRCEQVATGILSFTQDRAAERRPHDLNDLVQQVRDLATQSAAAAGAAVRLELTPALPHVVVNAGEISHALMSLLRTAFAAGSSSVRVRTRRRGDQVTIAIEDDGADLGRTLVAAGGDTSGAERSVGESPFGLSLVHGIVAEHGGAIDLQRTVGEGTTVTIQLPTPVAFVRV